MPAPILWSLVLRVSAVLALIAGLLLFAGATRTEDYFSWTIAPPQTAAFLGAAYWAAAVLFAWASVQRSWAQMRIAVYAETAVAVLLLIATYLHSDKFHTDVFGIFWFAVYSIAAPVLIYLFAITRTTDAHEPPPARLPMPGWLRFLIGLQALVMCVYAFGLYIVPSAFDGAWPWALTPLTARAVGAVLFGFAIAAVVALRENRLERFRGAALAYCVLGALELLALALHHSDFRGGAAIPVYAFFFASVLAVGLAGTLIERGAQVSNSRSALPAS